MISVNRNQLRVGLIKPGYFLYIPISQVSCMCQTNVAMTRMETALNKNPSKRP